MVYGLSAMADTIEMKDGRELKGIVVEEYKDRIIMSTADGEMTVMKPDIKELYFDNDEDNLIKLAEQARDRKDYVKALDYYDKVLQMNPDSKAAKDGITYLQLYLFKKDDFRKEDYVSGQAEADREASSGKDKELLEMQERLSARMGMAVSIEGNVPRVTSVNINSPAYEAGVRKGDSLVAIWGRLTGYMSLKEVIHTLIRKASLETRCTIERVAVVTINPRKTIASGLEDLIGASFKLTPEGLTVAKIKEGGFSDEAGLKEDDIITDIDGKSTRYMSLKKAVAMIKDSQEESVKLTFRRNAIIWRKGEI
jgi:C-terminal processing protease CtpA/Prc